MSDKKYIIVMRQESALTSWVRDLSTFTLCAALIGIGFTIGSTAMEFLGAIMSFITILSKSSGIVEKSTFDIDGAQRRLDEIKSIQSGDLPDKP